MSVLGQRRRRLSLLSMSAFERVGGALVILAVLWLLVCWAQGGGA